MSEERRIVIFLYFEGEDFLVDAEEEAHGPGPRQQSGDITADVGGHLHVVVFRPEVRLEQLDRFIRYRILGEVLQLLQERRARHHLPITNDKFGHVTIHITDYY